MNARALAATALKDVRLTLPAVAVWLALWAAGAAVLLFEAAPDERPWSELSLLDQPDVAFLYLLLGFGLAYVLLVPERIERTVGLLWALPVRREALYALKLAVALVVAAALVVWDSASTAAFFSFNQHSMLAAHFSWSELFLSALLGWGSIAVGIGYGAFLSHLRLFGAALFLLWLVVGVALAEFLPQIAPLAPTRLLDGEWVRGDFVAPGSVWLLQGIVACVAAAIGCALWTASADTPSSTAGNQRGGYWRVAGSVAVAIIAVLAGLGSNTATEGNLKTHATERFRFIYDARDTSLAAPLFARADGLGAAVFERLQAKHEGQILADLTDTSPNHLGIAGWNKLRIQRDALRESAEREHVFVHEAAHVAIAHAADRRLDERDSATRFFNEGLAEWLSYEILGATHPTLLLERAGLRDLAALTWTRHELRFSDLTNGAAFGRRIDENAVYALGEAWVGSLSETCGVDAPARVLSAFADPRGVQRLGPRGYWQDALQSAECNLGTVNENFAARQRATAVTLATVPDLGARIAPAGDNYLIAITLQGPPQAHSYTVIARIRDNGGLTLPAAEERRSGIAVGDTIEVSLPRGAIDGRRLEYQVGVVFRPGQRPYFGRWQSATLD
ncbi:MAG: hypothetical protein AAF515_09525 [Pseudomonadota bacterium]